MNIRKKIYEDLYIALTSPDLLISLDIPVETPKKHFLSPKSVKHLDALILNMDYSCQSIFNFLEPLILEISNGKIPDIEWPKYIYQYALSLSFPESIEISLDDDLNKAAIIYLEALKIFSKYEKLAPSNSFLSIYPFLLLSKNEYKFENSKNEYVQFVEAFEKDYLYEMMKLNQEIIGHNTLEHICGVHHVSLFIARQLKELNIPIDLCRVSGAAAGHDIGKYGCKSYESKRVPYLHYYYTDQWFKSRNMPYIGHIAVNHSVWDLELENISLESLVLIYSDFRVKNASDTSNLTMKIYDLDESFSVILDKLDNVDETKKKRYEKVYLKIKDFENYLIDLGVITAISPDRSSPIASKNNKFFTLLHGNEILENIKYLSISHNINLMNKLRDDHTLGQILERARSEKDSAILREYIEVFKEYSIHLTQKQKLMVLRFLYENLSNFEDDIRIECGRLMGFIIATFDEDYRKEIPENETIDEPETTGISLLKSYIQKILFPDHKMISLHRRWIGYSLSRIVESLFETISKKQIDSFRNTLLCEFNEIDKDDSINFYILRALIKIPVSEDIYFFDIFISHLLRGLSSPKDEVRILCLDNLRSFYKHLDVNSSHFIALSEFLNTNSTISNIIPEEFLRITLKNLFCNQNPNPSSCFKMLNLSSENLENLYLSNLKTATPWIYKKIQIELILEYALNDLEKRGLYTAMHFCNILKVSEHETVRSTAGKSLIKLVPNLPIAQINDISIELLRSLEMEGYQFTKYIPKYLGEIILQLPAIEFDELMDDLIQKIKNSTPKIISLLLSTIGRILSLYEKYHSELSNDISDNKRLWRLLGTLLNGMAHYDSQVRTIAFSVLGRDVFGSSLLSLNTKYFIFKAISKKLLTLLTLENNELNFLRDASSLNYIYKFITQYHTSIAPLEIPLPSKIAFFPGTFDPFSLSHKEISKEIRDRGFEVYISVDEFSWSKRTQPNLIRQKIINMSISDELGIYLYPGDQPVNIASSRDISRLINNFKHSQVHIVCGQDVIKNASAYKTNETLVTSLPHILFNRPDAIYPIDENNSYLDVLKNGYDILYLPPTLVDISSTQIRNLIDDNREISKLIDPLSEKYIYEFNLYKKEPMFKSSMQLISLDFKALDKLSNKLLEELSVLFGPFAETTKKIIFNTFNQKPGRIILLRDNSNPKKILGFSMFHRLHSSDIYKEFKNKDVSEYIRNSYVGRILVLDGVYSFSKNQDIRNILLTETLSYALERDYTYCIYNEAIFSHNLEDLTEILKCHGFIGIPNSNENHMVVNMSNPCTLTLDLESLIKEPFRSNPNIKKVLHDTRKRLLKAISKLYPGNLLLSFDMEIVHQRLVDIICKENEVSAIPTSPRILGEKMCVPFGNLLSRHIIPNTVCKSLHTEKVFLSDMSDFTIESFPNYLDLRSQIKMIKSFDRPVILLDDLLNKGYRINALDPILKEESLLVDKVIVGILTGRGKELMEIQGREVLGAYYVPKLKAWFNENSIYPFIGGDGIKGKKPPRANFIPSINLIFPYSSPSFIRDASSGDIYNLSLVCMENALEILTTLEKVYQELYERQLSLGIMSEVLLIPRVPECGEDLKYDLNIPASTHLKNDIEKLKRLEKNLI